MRRERRWAFSSLERELGGVSDSLNGVRLETSGREEGRVVNLYRRGEKEEGIKRKNS